MNTLAQVPHSSIRSMRGGHDKTNVNLSPNWSDRSFNTLSVAGPAAVLCYPLQLAKAVSVITVWFIVEYAESSSPSVPSILNVCYSYSPPRPHAAVTPARSCSCCCSCCWLCCMVSLTYCLPTTLGQFSRELADLAVSVSLRNSNKCGMSASPHSALSRVLLWRTATVTVALSTRTEKLARFNIKIKVLKLKWF